MLMLMTTVACGEKTKAQKANAVVEDIREAGKDLRQEGCEMVDGKMKCAAERVKRDLKDKTK